MISLKWADLPLPENLSIKTQPLASNQTSPHPQDLRAEIEITPPLTFPAELPSPRVEVKAPASDESGLESPRSKTIRSRSAKKKRELTTTILRHKRKLVTAKSSKSASKRLRPSQSASPPKPKGQKSKGASASARSKFTIKVKVNPKLQNGSSYDPGDLVKLTSAIYKGKKRVRDVAIRYEVSTRKKGKYTKLKKNKLRLKRTQYVRACIERQPKTCSSVIRLFVFDSSQTANDLLP